MGNGAELAGRTQLSVDISWVSLMVRPPATPAVPSSLVWITVTVRLSVLVLSTHDDPPAVEVLLVAERSWSRFINVGGTQCSVYFSEGEGPTLPENKVHTVIMTSPKANNDAPSLAPPAAHLSSCHAVLLVKRIWS